MLEAFRLATHANAALAGHPITWDLLPEFQGDTEWVFLIPGTNGYHLRKNPAQWIATMRERGDREAWFSFGPTSDLRGEGIRTEGAGSWFYHLSGSRVPQDAHLRMTLRAHAFQANESLTLDAATATIQFRAAIPPMLDHARARPGKEFVPYLEGALALLDGLSNPDLEMASYFPPGLYPDENVRLFAAARRGDVFGSGGMGWWYDTAVRDTAFEEATKAYGNAFYSAFIAASRFIVE